MSSQGPSFFDFKQSLLTPPAAGKPGAAISVSQLTSKIDRALKTALPSTFLVKGEASNFKQHSSSGHAYFTLKDQDACIDCVMFKAEFASLKFRPTDGLELLATGRVGIYPARGRYQLYVSDLTPFGKGPLELAFQQLRAKLQAEGLFAPERKRPLPRYPRHIAIVTSRQTAALQDILKVFSRFAFLKVSVHHVPVQGDGAAAKISELIGRLSASVGSRAAPQLIVLARGGGSLEDLWAFNEEMVARACAGCRIPIVTGIGHEIDISIADLVADYHAHTPTEAAQVTTLSWRSAPDLIGNFGHRLGRSIRQQITAAQHQLTAAERHEFFRRPMDRINLLRQRLDDHERSLSYSMESQSNRLHRRLHEIASRLDRHRPVAQIERLRHRLAFRAQSLSLTLQSTLQLVAARVGTEDQRLRSAARHRQQMLAGQLSAMETQLRLVGPQNVLQRGYSITTIKRTGQIVRSVKEIRGRDRLITRVADGTIESVADDPNQPNLFE